jgi:hypothetical protein
MRWQRWAFAFFAGLIAIAVCVGYAAARSTSISGSVAAGIVFAILAVPAARLAAGRSRYEPRHGIGFEAAFLTCLIFSLAMAALFPLVGLLGSIGEFTAAHSLRSFVPNAAGTSAFFLMAVIAFLAALAVSLPASVIGWFMFNGLVRLAALTSRGRPGTQG